MMEAIHEDTVRAAGRAVRAAGTVDGTLDLDAPPQSQAMPGGAGREAQQQHQVPITPHDHRHRHRRL